VLRNKVQRWVYTAIRGYAIHKYRLRGRFYYSISKKRSLLKRNVFSYRVLKSSWSKAVLPKTRLQFSKKFKRISMLAKQIKKNNQVIYNLQFKIFRQKWYFKHLFLFTVYLGSRRLKIRSSKNIFGKLNAINVAKIGIQNSLQVFYKYKMHQFVMLAFQALLIKKLKKSAQSWHKKLRRALRKMPRAGKILQKCRTKAQYFFFRLRHRKLEGAIYFIPSKISLKKKKIKVLSRRGVMQISNLRQKLFVKKNYYNLMLLNVKYVERVYQKKNIDGAI